MTKKYKIVNYIGGKKPDEYIYKTDKLNNSIKKYKIVNYIGGKIPDEYSYITDKLKNDIKKILEIIFKKKELFDLIMNTITNKIPKEKQFILNKILSIIKYDEIKKQIEKTETFDKKITDVLGALLTVYLKIKNNTTHEVNTSDVKSIIESLIEFLLFILDIGFIYRSIIRIGIGFIKINETILQENINRNKTFFNNFDLKKFFDLTYSKIIGTEQKNYSDKLLEVLNEIINEKEIPKEINTNILNTFLKKVFDDYKEDEEIHKILQDPNSKPILIFFYYNVLPIDFVPEEYKEQVKEHRIKTLNQGILIEEKVHPYAHNEANYMQKLEELEKKLVEIKESVKSIKDPNIFKKTPVEPLKLELQPKTEEQKEDRKKRVSEFKQMSEDEKLEFIKKKKESQSSNSQFSNSQSSKSQSSESQSSTSQYSNSQSSKSQSSKSQSSESQSSTSQSSNSQSSKSQSSKSQSSESQSSTSQSSESQSSKSQSSTTPKTDTSVKDKKQISTKKKWDEISDDDKKIILQKQTAKKEKKAEPKPVAKPKQKQEPVAKPKQKQEPVAKPKQKQEPVAKTAAKPKGKK